MALNVTGTSFAAEQFGVQADDVVREVVAAMTDAQTTARRTQQASGMTKRYAFGSTWWISRYDELVERLSALPGAEVVKVERAPYQLVRINGRLLIPFTLSRSLADIPARPKLTSDVVAAIAQQTVPTPAPHPALFDLRPASNGEDTTEDEVDLPHPRGDEDTEDGPEPQPPVFVGVVGNAESETLLELWWGTPTSIAEDKTMEWSPERLPLKQPTTPGSEPRNVPDAAITGTAKSFDSGSVPDVPVPAREIPLQTTDCDATGGRPSTAPSEATGTDDASRHKPSRDEGGRPRDDEE